MTSNTEVLYTKIQRYLWYLWDVSKMSPRVLEWVFGGWWSFDEMGKTGGGVDLVSRTIVLQLCSLCGIQVATTMYSSGENALDVWHTLWNCWWYRWYLKLIETIYRIQGPHRPGRWHCPKKHPAASLNKCQGQQEGKLGQKSGKGTGSMHSVFFWVPCVFHVRCGQVSAESLGFRVNAAALTEQRVEPSRALSWATHGHCSTAANVGKFTPKASGSPFLHWELKCCVVLQTSSN